MKDLVKIKCYDKISVMDRSEAIKKFSRCVLCSEGSEQSRYAEILSQLLSGYKYCYDEEDREIVYC